MALAAPAAAALPFACELVPLGDGASSSTTTTTSGTAGQASAGSGSQATGSAASSGSGQADPCEAVGYLPEVPDTCGAYSHLPCGIPASMSLPGGSGCFLYLADCDNICTSLFFNCHAVDKNCDDAGTIVPDDAGAVDIDCTTCPGAVGRVPEGLASATVPRCSPVADYFTRAAHLEAASVYAFARLHEELGRYGAPARILTSVRRAKRDEVRHARMTSAMARRFGGKPRRPKVDAVAPRALAAIALENAMEGCVRETFGALVASFQAQRSTDARVRSMMRTIARDETRHAALSWSVARWAEPRLGPDDRARIRVSARQALDALRVSFDVSSDYVTTDSDLQTKAGLPDRAQYLSLLDTLEAALF